MEVIDTERLVLLPLLVEHAAEMAAVLSDPRLHRFVGGSPGSLNDLRSRYERLVAGSPDPEVSWLNWVIQLREQDRLVGTVQATISPSVGGRTAEVAWVVGIPWQGQGFAAEAARGLVSWLARQPVQAVIAHVHPDHQASAAVATASGLTPTDELVDGEVRWELRIR